MLNQIESFEELYRPHVLHYTFCQHAQRGVSKAWGSVALWVRKDVNEDCVWGGEFVISPG